MVRNIVICDDDPLFRADIFSQLRRFGDETGDELKIQRFSSGEALLDNWPEDTQVLLLDIKMGELSGMEAARRLRRMRSRVHIIFLTSMVQYALEGYDVRAFSFLEKPVYYETLREKLLGVFRLVDEDQKFILRLRDASGVSLVAAEEIDYIEVQKHTVTIYHGGETDRFVLSMKELETQLAGRGFFRCHKGYMVNFQKIIRIEAETVLMPGGARIPLSRHRREAFLRAFDEFMGERLYG